MTPTAVQQDVVTGKGVVALAMRLLASRPVQVVQRIEQPEVLGVDAPLVVADVVDDHVRRDLAVMLFEGDAVRELLALDRRVVPVPVPVR